MATCTRMVCQSILALGTYGLELGAPVWRRGDDGDIEAGHIVSLDRKTLTCTIVWGLDDAERGLSREVEDEGIRGTFHIPLSRFLFGEYMVGVPTEDDARGDDEDTQYATGKGGPRPRLHRPTRLIRNEERRDVAQVFATACGVRPGIDFPATLAGGRRG